MEKYLVVLGVADWCYDKAATNAWNAQHLSSWKGLLIKTGGRIGTGTSRRGGRLAQGRRRRNKPRTTSGTEPKAARGRASKWPGLPPPPAVGLNSTPLRRSSKRQAGRPFIVASVGFKSIGDLSKAYFLHAKHATDFRLHKGTRRLALHYRTPMRRQRPALLT